jgi:hypothetical protein
MLPATKNEAFTKDAATAALGGFGIDTLAAKHGISEDAALALIDAAAVAINQEVAEMVADGRDVAPIAKAALVEALRQLAGHVDDGNLPPALLIRIIEATHKVSGVEAKQKANQEPAGSKFSITIVIPGQEIIIGEPPKEPLEGESEVIDCD